MNKLFAGDLDRTQIINNLLLIPKAERNAQWREKFLNNVIDAKFSCGDPQILKGPDGYYYLNLLFPETHGQTSTVVIRQLMDDLIDRGIGAAINPHQNPDWVFTSGDILNYKLNSEFYTATPNFDLEKEEVIQKEEEVLVGQPSEVYLPLPARNSIRNFLLQLNIENPKILLLARTKPQGMLQELAFNITRSDFDEDKDFDYAMQSVSWFLPSHYTVISLSMDSNVGDSFMPL
ncbi:MAG TPA: hypothetical protein VF691_06065 [Cytophagaceae bacterium]|jgi:hypothetical protein